MRKITSFVLAIVILVCSTAFAVDAAETIGYSISSPSLAVFLGKEFDVTVSLDEHSSSDYEIRGMQIDIGSIDPEYVEVVSHSSLVEDDAAASNKTSFSSEQNFVRFVYLNVSGTMDSSVADLMTVRFKVNEDVASDVTVTFPVTMKIGLKGESGTETLTIEDSVSVSLETTHNPAEPVKENPVSPTCTETGSYDEVVYCSTCGEELSREEKEIEAAGHSPAEAVVENKVDPSCTETGSYDEVVYCSVCSAELSREKKEIALVEHTPAKAVVENKIDPSCTETGSYDEVVYCSVCSAELSREKKEIALAEHTPAKAVVENEIAPTCTEAGSYDEVEYCSVCGVELSRDSFDTEATGHNWGAWTVTTPATCEKYGEETRVCANDEAHFEKRPIDATGHNIVFVDRVEATYEASGNIEHWACTNCGKCFSDAEGASKLDTALVIIPKLSAIKGDLDDDGHINALDVIALMRFMVGWRDLPISFQIADYNGDGHVNNRDVHDILNDIVNGVFD